MLLRFSVRRTTLVTLVRPPRARLMSNSAQATKAPLVLSSDKNGVRTLTMNDPAKLNGWTKPMMTTLFDAFNAAAADPEVLSYPWIFDCKYSQMMIGVVDQVIGTIFA